MTFSMAGMIWRLSTYWHRLTPMHLFAAAAVLLIVALEIFAIRPLAHQIDAVIDKKTDAVAERLLAESHRQRAFLKINRDAKALLSLLPPAAEQTRQLTQVEVLARKHGLVWMGTDYPVTDIKTLPTGIIKKSMRISLQGNYSALRTFLNRLLADMPFVAVDALSFISGTAQAPASIQLDISVYLRSDTTAMHSKGSSASMPSEAAP